MMEYRATPAWPQNYSGHLARLTLFAVLSVLSVIVETKSQGQRSVAESTAVRLIYVGKVHVPGA